MRRPRHAWPGSTALVGTLTLLAAVLRLTSLDLQSFWLDEAHTAFYVQDQVNNPGVFWERLTRPGENGPLYYLLLAPWYALFGGGEASLRAFSALVSLPSIPLAYLVLSRLVERRVALLGTALFALAPYQTWYAREAKMYTLLLTVSLGALWLYLAAGDARGWRRPALWLVYLPTAFASIYVHFFGLLTVGSHGLAALWRYRAERGRLVAALAAVAAVTLPVAGAQLVAIERDVAGSGATGAGFSPTEQAGILLYAYTLNTAPAPLPLVLFATLFLMIAGCAVLIRQRDGVTLLLLAFGPLAAFGLASAVFRSSLFADRYFIGVTPLLYGIFAAGLVWLWDRWRAGGAAAAALVCAAWLYGTVHQLAVPTKEDYRAALAQYKAESLTGDAFVPVPNFLSYPAGYYAEGTSFTFVDGPAAGAGGSGGAGAVDHAAAFGSARRVWVLSNAPDALPPLKDLRDWLAANGRLAVDERLAGGVRLERYDLAR